MLQRQLAGGVSVGGEVGGRMAGAKERRKESSAKPSSADPESPGEENQENLWSSLLGEVQTSRTSQLPTSKSLLVLGDKESGKTTLIAKLQGNEDPKKGSGLEYGYIDVRDEYRDDHTRLSHWILDGDSAHANLLNFALTEKNYEGKPVIYLKSSLKNGHLTICTLFRHNGANKCGDDNALEHDGPASKLGESSPRPH